MRKIKVFKLATLLTLVFIFDLGCRKVDIEDEVQVESDYRDAYTGIWNFNVEKSGFIMNDTGSYYHHVYTYEGEAFRGDLDSQIAIKYTSEDTVTLSIGENGALSGFPTNQSSGQFLSYDSLNLYFRWGGQGGATTHKVEGSKK